MGLFEETLERTHRLAQKMLEEEEERRKREEEERKAREAKTLMRKEKARKEKDLKAWRVQYPTAIVSVRIIGDPSYASNFMGEGKALLYDVINAMKFNNLGSFQNERRYKDGSIVRASSVFGQNVVEIDVSKSIAPEAKVGVPTEELTCEVTLIDVSNFVQPMRYPGEIHAGEVENKDYLKIYYTFDDTKCLNCSEIKFEVLASDCTYSLEHECWGQIIEKGEDNGGKYILVKFFTEKTYFSRTGLSDMILRAWIEKPDGSIACNAIEEINVNCCEKDAGDRLVKMRWNHNCEACEVPASNSVSDIAQATPFFASPGGDGGCIPYTWWFTGPGSIVIGDKEFFTSITYYPPEDFGCDEDVTLYLIDRCGNQTEAYFAPCCDNPNPLTMGYTSLGMSCNGQQTLTAIGGCGPYSWAATSGSLSAFTGEQVIYTAPGSNYNCQDNPTIVVTDCCGNSAEVNFAVNCYTQNDSALGVVEFTLGYCGCSSMGCEQGACCSCKWVRTDWNCAGTIVVYCVAGPSACDPKNFPLEQSCTDPPMGQGNCCFAPVTSCGQHDCECINNQYCPCGVLVDGRTTTMKNQGCCPLNPFTGLPYTG